MKENLISMPEVKEALDQRPYVVSGDIKTLLTLWADDRGFQLPDDEFFRQLRSDFGEYMSQIFPGFEYIPEDELTRGLCTLVSESGVVPLSLDRVYYPTDLRIDIARQVDAEGNDRGLSRRGNSPALITQFRRLKKSGVQEVSLVDDVIFSGDLISRVGKALNTSGVRVAGIYAGIGIQEGLTLLEDQGYNVECVRSYDSVIDEICERDFYPGVPFSGRLVDPENNVGAPYVLPFGNPAKWASIPESWQRSFSNFCILQTIKLFNGIEQTSNKGVLCNDLGRKVLSIPTNDVRFVDALQNVLSLI